MSEYHVPVMLQACMDGLALKPNGVYVDVTFGGGGHSKEILKQLKNGKLYGFDQDEDAEKNIPDDPRFVFVRSNFRYLRNFLKYHDETQVDGILADLGVSSHHFDDNERGFSFRFEEGALDMRMNQKAGLKASDIVNTYTEEKLASIFYQYGELKNSRKIATALVKARLENPIETVADFLEVIRPFFFREKEKKDMARVFQALRIEVNQEMQALEEMLQQSLEALKPGGRMVVMTYHSLEDRIVKNFFKTGNFEGKSEQDFYGNFLTPFKLINNKVIIADEQEQVLNPRSRSAKLRIVEKK
ncbi:MAG TPA: 16S rRNA (cytosine(1402)-N(4))-methyltransferase RsmH [Bacteroidales bacterium]|nr:16S rRNA (cytosine(1402)-N(4))-methyltransferase RsmH [Bacteroidales bacterium]